GACAARPGPLRILTAARLHWKKGHEHALAAVAALRAHGVDVRYRIVGSGPHEAAVRAAIAHHGLEDVVEIHGTCPPEVVREHLWWADVVLHGATSEGFCNAVVEAQACGVPVVCTDADGLPENVAHEVSGLVVPRRNPAALAEALASLACDPCRRRELGAAGRQRAVTLFGLDDHLDRWQAFFEALAP
ncbi:MAG: glycosyltransferase family 4 protein, partial [Acidimicrobiia bacterium]